MKLVLKLGMIALLAATLDGCAWARTRQNDPEIMVRAQSIRVGATKAAELPAILKAQPTRKRVHDGIITYEYSYGDSKTESLMLLVVNFSRTEDSIETLYVDVDAESGVVVAVPKSMQHTPEWRGWPFDD